MDEHEQLVGRAGELADLRAWLADARAGSGRVALVSGPAGIGKTRLAEELVAGLDVPVGWGAAIDDAGMPPLWPWARAVRLLPGVREAVEQACHVTGSASSASDAAAAEFAAHTALLDALDALGVDRGGLVLVVEDMHWADEASARLLDRLAGGVRRMPVLVVATHRPPVGGPLAERLPELRTRAGSELLRLAPLPEDEAATLVHRAAVGAHRDAVRRIVGWAGGNPLYLRTAARAAPDLLRRPDAGPGDLTRLPELRDVVVHALAAAGPRAVEVAEALSVLGAEAETAVLAAVAQTSVDDIQAAVRRAEPAGIVERIDADRVGFAHALVRDAVHAQVGAARRAALHRRAAEVLETRAGSDAGRCAGELAGHWLNAGEPTRASLWAERAAGVAVQAGAFALAAAHLRRAVDAEALVEPDARDGSRLPGLLLALARATYLAGDLAASLDACRRASDEGLRAGDPTAVARAAVIVQGVADPQVNDAVDRLCQLALAALERTGHDDAESLALRAQVEAQLAHVSRHHGDLSAALTWSHRALEHAKSSGDVAAELDAIGARGPLTLAPRFAAERLDLGRRSINLATAAGRPLAELWGRGWRADAFMESADITAATRELFALGALAERTQLPIALWQLLRRRAAHAALVGDFDAAMSLSLAANEHAETLGDISALGMHVGLAVFMARVRGVANEFVEQALDFLAMAPPLEVTRASSALALLVLGRREDAADTYQSLALDSLVPDNPILLPVLPYAVELAVEFRDVDRCRRLAQTCAALHQYAAALGSGTVAYLGSVARVRGHLESVSADADTAILLLEEGIAVDSTLGARPYVVHGRTALARQLLRRGSPSDLHRARDLATAAAHDARRLGMPMALATADALLTRTRIAAQAADPLTPREREVASLVAQAKSKPRDRRAPRPLRAHDRGTCPQHPRQDRPRLSN